MRGKLQAKWAEACSRHGSALMSAPLQLVWTGLGGESRVTGVPESGRHHKRAQPNARIFSHKIPPAHLVERGGQCLCLQLPGINICSAGEQQRQQRQQCGDGGSTTGTPASPGACTDRVQHR